MQQKMLHKVHFRRKELLQYLKSILYILMDKVHLLEELAHLKRLIKNHEHSCALSKLQEENVDSVDKLHQTIIKKQKGKDAIDQRNCRIFINPVKMTTVHNQKQLITDNNKAIMKNVSATVYINPNFSKAKISKLRSEISPSHNRARIVHMKSNILKKDYVSQDVKLQNSPQEGGSSVKPQVVSLKAQASSTSVSKSTCKETNNLKIFVNPEFRMQQELKKKSVSEIQSQTSADGLKKQSTSQTTMPSFQAKSCQLFTENHSKGSGNLTDSNISKEVTALSIHKKRKIYMNRLLASKEVVNVKRRKRSVDADSQSGKKIFLNPKFKRGFEDLEVPSTSNYEKKINPEGNISVRGTLQLNMTMGNVLSKKKDLSVNGPKPILSSPGTCKKILIHTKELPKKIVGQRLRTRSTCLVSVSPTKLIRKRKSSQNMSDSNIKMAPNKPMLLTKNKLVRYSPIKKAGMNNIMIVGKVFNKNSLAKYKVNHTLQKTNGQCTVNTNEIIKRKSIGCKSNIAVVPTSSTIVARIRSKNGKSLKVVRKNIDRNKHLSEQSLSVNALQVRKTQTKQRANNKVLCNIITNVTKKNQFSKVNVPVNKTSHPTTVNRNKYVYKKADKKEKLLTKSALMEKAKKLALIKANSRNNVSERLKFIQSKYSLIRKQSLKSLKLRSNKDTKSRKMSTLLSRKKWKLENHLLKNKRKNMKIVNIGGVFYHCSRTSLTRNKPTRKALQEKRKGLLLHIHGQRFQFYNNGKSSKCLDKNHGRRRIDIGGVTYIRSSTGTSLTKTNYHTARSILVQAKQRSISLLNRKLRKNNEPCPLYHRFGRCSGKERGTCVRQHNPKFVAVCKKFVQGACSDSHCLLSHEMTCHNMPRCQHFLAGHCGRDNCPYPHIKVSDSSPLCLDFLKGFCSLGDQCAKRHQAICPSFEKGTCSRGKYCPYPHPKSKSDEKLKGKFKYLKSKTQPVKHVEKVSHSNLRYFEDVNLQKENEIQLTENLEKTMKDSALEEDEERSHPFKNRPRLGSLPSFIPLSFDDSTVEDSTPDP